MVHVVIVIQPIPVVIEEFRVVAPTILVLFVLDRCGDGCEDLQLHASTLPTLPRHVIPHSVVQELERLHYSLRR
jgi:hypothetical protein